jgi:5-methylcytosine-specific restriction enzyme A
VKAALRPCAEPGCPELVERHCPRHPPVTGASSGLYGGDWPSAARQYLREHPLCVYCRTARASEVHHDSPVRTGGSRMDQRNWRATCHQCHQRITSLTQARTTKPRRFGRRLR